MPTTILLPKSFALDLYPSASNPKPRPREVFLSSVSPTSSTPPNTAAPSFGEKLCAFQVKYPSIVLAAAALLTALSIVFALRLRVLVGFESLLPETRASVKELDRVAAKTAGVSTLFIVLSGGKDTQTEKLRKAADALVPELVKLGPPWVGSAEDGVHAAADFLTPRAGLYAEQDKLEKLRDDVNARFEYEVSKASDTLLEDTEPPPEINEKSLRESFELKDIDENRWPDGYYQSKDGKTLVVAVRSKVLGSDFEGGTEALRRIREVVDRVNPSSFDPAIQYGFAGDLQTGISEYTAINKDLTDVGILGAALIAGVVLLYYLRIRTLVAMLTTIGIGVAWTFGVTQLLVGHLNMATGFLFTIVAGNGINTSIIFMARYLEARRKHEPLARAVRIAQSETWLPTLTAALAASAAYGSLLVTEFRGFRDFGLIGGAGMIICWACTLWVLPSILVVIERLLPLDREAKGFLGRFHQWTSQGIAFGKPFAALIPRAPRAIVLSGIALSVIGVFLTVKYVRDDPMEYDLKNLRTDPKARAEQIRLTKVAEEITGHVSADGMAILVDAPEQVPALKEALYAIRDKAPADKKPFKELHTLQDFIPTGQEAKIVVLLEIKSKVMRAKKRGVLDADALAKIEKFLPPDDLKPFGINDLPAEMSRLFTESDGTRGRIVYISPVSPDLVDDAHYLFRWADAYRSTTLPDGKVILGSGRAVIYADMWSAILDDVPPAIVCSFGATLLAVLIAFRRGRPALYVLVSLAAGITWMAALLALLHVKINFLNFIALPITFGIGVDYAVNIVQRYMREGAGGALVAVEETGGAVVLCSLTTMLGYLALVGSENFAVRSMGIAAVIGEVTCLLAAVLVLPAVLLWQDKKPAP